MTKDMTPRTAGFIESAATLLLLSRQHRPTLQKWDHQGFAATGLMLLFGECIQAEDISSAVETATLQEGIK